MALRQGVRDLVPRAREQVDGLQDGLPQGFPDNDNLSVLRLLCGAPSTCTLSIRQDDGEAFSAECRLEGEALLQALVVSFGSSGRLLRVSVDPVDASSLLEKCYLRACSHAQWLGVTVGTPENLHARVEAHSQACSKFKRAFRLFLIGVCTACTPIS